MIPFSKIFSLSVEYDDDAYAITLFALFMRFDGTWLQIFQDGTHYIGDYEGREKKQEMI